MRYHFSTVILLIILLLAYFGNGQAQNSFTSQKRAGKEPLSGQLMPENSFPIFEISQVDEQCIQDCLRHSQMAAVGYDILELQCRRQCEVDQALRLLQSADQEQYAEGVRMLCRSGVPRTVGPLINALKRDLRERLGLWAEIIPALGILRDQSAVPVLVETLNMMEDDWLGREMSARALGDIGDSSAIPALIAAVWRYDTRDAAIKALARFHDKRIIPALLSTLTPEEEAETRQAAINGLHNLGPAAVPEMIDAFSSFSPEFPDTQKRLWLCQLLGESRDARAVQRLQASRNDPDPAVARCANQTPDNGSEGEKFYNLLTPSNEPSPLFRQQQQPGSGNVNEPIELLGVRAPVNPPVQQSGSAGAFDQLSGTNSIMDRELDGCIRSLHLRQDFAQPSEEFQQMICEGELEDMTAMVYQAGQENPPVNECEARYNFFLGTLDQAEDNFLQLASQEMKEQLKIVFNICMLQADLFHYRTSCPGDRRQIGDLSRLSDDFADKFYRLMRGN